jgi:hypothetical protein
LVGNLRYERRRGELFCVALSCDMAGGCPYFEPERGRECLCKKSGFLEDRVNLELTGSSVY